MFGSVHFSVSHIFISSRIYHKSKEVNINSFFNSREISPKKAVIWVTFPYFFPSRRESHSRHVIANFRPRPFATSPRPVFIGKINTWRLHPYGLTTPIHCRHYEADRAVSRPSSCLPSLAFRRRTSISDFARDPFPFSAVFPPGLWFTITSSAPYSPCSRWCNAGQRSNNAPQPLYGLSICGISLVVIRNCRICRKAKIRVDFIR